MIKTTFGRILIKSILLNIFLLISLLTLAAPNAAKAQYDIDWIAQFGTTAGDGAMAVASDASGYVLAGYTEGSLPGFTNAGGIDAFLRRFDFDGNGLWTRQFGTAANDAAMGVALDSTGITVVGYTRGSFPGFCHAGDNDAFVRRYDLAGNELWTDQFGTGSRDDLFSVVADHRGIWAAGRVSFGQPVVRRYEIDGTLVWERVFGTSATDLLFGVTIDPEGVTVTGFTDGTFIPGMPPAGYGTPDVIVRRYDPDGNELWTRQFGTNSHDQGRGIAADGSGLTVAGFTEGSLPGCISAGGRVVLLW